MTGDIPFSPGITLEKIVEMFENGVEPIYLLKFNEENSVVIIRLE